MAWGSTKGWRDGSFVTESNPIISVKSKKEFSLPTDTTSSSEPDSTSDQPFELTPEEIPPEPEKVLADIVQRPNAVLKNGGPQLLRGLMLPLAPSANRYWTQSIMVAKGSKYPLTIIDHRRLFKVLRVLQFRSTEAKRYCETMKEHGYQRGFSFHTIKPLRMDVVVCPRDRRSIDPHNYTKVLLDVFEDIGVYEDDSQVVDLRVRLGPIIKGGRMIISLWEITPDKQAILNEAWV